MINKKQTPKPDIIFTAAEDSELLECVVKQLVDVPKGKIKSYLEHRQISVNGYVTSKFDYRVKGGHTVRIRRSGTAVPSEFEIEIIYEDDYLLAVNKPSGLLSVATDTEKERTAYRFLKESGRSQLFVVHRLDRDTSGVLIFAKTPEVRDEIQNNWDKTPRREYTAICEGVFAEKRGRCDTVLSETSTFVLYSVPNGEGKRAITNYEVLRENENYSLVKVWIETGRKNQIRVHMSELSHPVAGDKKYGAKTNPLGRLGLHANHLEIIHPITKKPLIIKAKADIKFKLPKIRNNKAKPVQSSSGYR